MWRTLIADVWQDQHPAPINAGFAFADFLIEGMLQLILRFQMINAGRVKEIRNMVVDPVSTCLNDPAKSEANTVERMSNGLERTNRNSHTNILIGRTVGATI
jgi:hypothetical protein